MRGSKFLLWFALLGCVAPLALTTPVYAEDDDDDDDEFETTWFGVRIGMFYHPEITFNVKVGGTDPTNPLSAILPTDLNAERDLGIKQNPGAVWDALPIDFDEEVILEIEPFIQLGFIGVSLQLVTPFEYSGKTNTQQTFGFGGFSFTANTDIETTFRQFFMGAEAHLNIFDNRYFKIAPFLALRAIGIDWEVAATTSAGGRSRTERGDTSDIDSPLEFDDYQVFPYPELGVTAAVGYRSLFDVSLKLAASWVDYFGFQGGTYKVEVAATLYPIDQIGIQLGFRWIKFDLSSKTDDNDELFSFSLEYTGATFGIIVRL